MAWCAYYQAQVVRSQTWFFVAVMRSFEHYAFDRTYDKQDGVFEFFVPVSFQAEFERIMQYFQDQQVVFNVVQLPNRLMNPDAQL
jgi:hypothetical protein